MATTFDPRQFFQAIDNVALHVSASELFGWMKRSLDLPPQWAALVHRGSSNYVVVPASGAVDADEAEDVLFVRVSAVELGVSEDGLLSRDQLKCRAGVSFRVAILPERGELQSFLNTVVGSHRVIQTKDLTKYLAPAIRAGLAPVSLAHDAAGLVDATNREELSAAVAKAMEAPLFAAGMILDGAPAVVFESATLREVRKSEQRATVRRAEHEASRQMQEALERAQSQHLDHLSSLLGRLKELAAGSPDVGLPDLVRSFSERERGELYEAIFAEESCQSRTQWLVIASGDELLFYDPCNLESPSRRVTIAGDVGSIRSVQTIVGARGETWLMLGAATGVYRLPLDADAPDRVFSVELAPPVSGGFNAVAHTGAKIVASHSELGLYEWQVDDPTSARSLFASMTRDAKAVRAVALHDGTFYCGVDDHVIAWPTSANSEHPVGDGAPERIYTGSAATITAICPTADGLIAGNGEGEVLRWSGDRRADPERLHSGSQRAVESIWMLASPGVNRLVFVDTSLSVQARVLGDSFTCQYQAGGQTLRRLEVASDLLVATNDLRDRLICWAPGHPNAPSATVSVARLTGRSIQDVCLVATV